MAEELFLKLTDNQLSESVHLMDWPEFGHINETLITNMAHIRQLITIGLSLRAEKAIKVRQPLAKATLQWTYGDLAQELIDLIGDELNVKTVEIDDRELKPEASFLENIKEDNFKQLYRIELDTKITPKLKREGLMREVTRQVQNARKSAKLNVDDRIHLGLKTDTAELKQAINEFDSEIKAETLATSLKQSVDGYRETVKIDGHELEISLTKQA